MKIEHVFVCSVSSITTIHHKHFHKFVEESHTFPIMKIIIAHSPLQGCPPRRRLVAGTTVMHPSRKVGGGSDYSRVMVRASHRSASRYVL